MISSMGSNSSPAVAAWPDGETLGEVVQPDPGGDRHADPQGGLGGLAWIRASSAGSVAWARMSNSKNTRIPADRALRNARLRAPANWTRPSGSPRKMVSPATAPSAMVWDQRNTPVWPSE